MKEGGDSCLFLAGRGLLCSDSDEEGVGRVRGSGKFSSRCWRFSHTS
jgi:hypothetical protein